MALAFFFCASMYLLVYDALFSSMICLSDMRVMLSLGIHSATLY